MYNISLNVSQHGLYQVEILLSAHTGHKWIILLSLPYSQSSSSSQRLVFTIFIAHNAKKTERNVPLWFEKVGFLACIKHFMGLVDRIEGRKLTHMRYNELWLVIDGFPMVKILELRELFSRCLGTLYPGKIGKDLIKRFLLQKRFSQLQTPFRFVNSISQNYSREVQSYH